MAKKRKAAAQPQDLEAPLNLAAESSRKRIRTYEDVADSDDEFHLNRDEVLLGEDTVSKRRRKVAEAEEFLQPSDEEVLGYSEDESEAANGTLANDAQSDSDEEEKKGGRAADEEEEEMGWGTSKADLYGADQIETEEQALEEEAEALRLQKKQLEQMRAADYGFDEDEWQQNGVAKPQQEEEEGAVVTEVLPQLQIDPDMPLTERTKLLKSRYPEFEPLSKDLLHLNSLHASLVATAAASSSSAVARVKLRAASAYLGALIMYFSLFTSTASKDSKGAVAMASTKLRDHPLMDSLVECRELWRNVEDLSDEPLSGQDQDSSDEEETDSLENGQSDVKQVLASAPVKSQRSRAERHADALDEAKMKRRAERMSRTEADLSQLDELLAPSAKKAARASRKTQTNDDASDIGEEVPLTAREAADKASRKKSLRFYTSQIAQKANKRGTAGRNAGGDDDIPHRERLRDRQARLNAEAEKRGRGAKDIGDDLGGDSDEEDHKQAKQIREDNEDDYYDLVAARTAKKKGDKAALAEAQRKAALEGGQVVQEEIVGADGKRKISYLIEKNKGLTPHRKKDVRNPRVKKRKKFEEKKKKLASIKPVYKGGEGRGGYGGELTGIKKGLVKSTKLS